MQHGPQAPFPHLLPPPRRFVRLRRKVLRPHGLDISRTNPVEQRGVSVLLISIIEASGESVRDALQIVTSVAPEAALTTNRQLTHVQALYDQGLRSVCRSNRMAQMVELEFHLTRAMRPGRGSAFEREPQSILPIILSERLSTLGARTLPQRTAEYLAPSSCGTLPAESWGQLKTSEISQQEFGPGFLL